jgi:hypothetical protein
LFSKVLAIVSVMTHQNSNEIGTLGIYGKKPFGGIVANTPV